ncbi:MAG: hypothetical protein AB1457_01910 [Chloroflexota bacterium]
MNKIWKYLLGSILISLIVIGILQVSNHRVAASGGDPTTGIVIVKKDAKTSFERQWDWTITKKGDQTSLTLAPGQVFPVNYAVTVQASAEDSNWKVTGTISFQNTASEPATITAVTDVISGGIVANVNCGVSFPFTLPAGFTKVCTYEAALPDGSSRTNTATVETSGDVPGSSVTIPFSFGNPSTETDECITVEDNLFGTLGTVCAGESPKTFSYTMNVGGVEQCGTYELANVATFVTNDSGSKGSDKFTVNFDIPCAGACTLTPGYWKTHSKYGPAPYDSTWALLGEDNTFFLSGITNYQVLWTSPSGGNAYYILAHAYLAAKLNILNGASTTANVDAALSYAQSFFNTYTPASTLSRSVRNAAIAQAEVLDSYNNGLIGPGHCSQ